MFANGGNQRPALVTEYGAMNCESGLDCGVRMMEASTPAHNAHQAQPTTPAGPAQNRQSLAGVAALYVSFVLGDGAAGVLGLHPVL
jgi:hypothetical protein